MIDGIDLDVEEYVELSKIENLIKLIKKDFGPEFIISMAQSNMRLKPIILVWADLFTKLLTRIGELIDYFNVNATRTVGLTAYENMINNGYPKEKIIMGSISCQDINQNLETIKSAVKKYPDF